MNHEMKLSQSAFAGIKSGKQKYELRLLDDKRSKVQIGDLITFSKLPELKETITAEVTKIIKAGSFEELSAQSFGELSVRLFTKRLCRVYGKVLLSGRSRKVWDCGFQH